MKNIKFRIWDKDRGEVAFVGAMDWAHENDASPITCNTSNNKLYKYDEYLPIMQFTGLLDKNGKEIYEGDIVAFDERYIGDSLVGAGTGVVHYADGSFYINTVLAPDLCRAEIFNCNITVRGCIYENLEGVL